MTTVHASASAPDHQHSNKVLVFDIGGVLYENIGFDVLREMLGHKSAQQVRDIWLNSKTVDSFETGHMDQREFADTIVQELHLQLTPQQFLDKFVTWPRGFYPGAPKLIQQLRQQYRVGCFSNSNVLHWRDEFDGMFDFALASHRIGVAKPKPAAFDYLIQAVAVPAQQLYFFDDSESNVKAGRQAGLHAFVTDGLQGVLAVLQAQGLYP